MKSSPEYQWSDAWLLQAIITGSGDDGATLYDIISTGDALNHAIFRNDELESGFARLTAGGLVEERDGRFFATAKAAELCAKAYSRPGGIHAARKRLAKALGAEPWQSDAPNPKNTLKYPGFSPAKVGEAVRQWQKEAERLTQK